MALSRTDILSAVRQSRRATVDLTRLLGQPDPLLADVQDALARGAVLADVQWTRKGPGPHDREIRQDVWGRLQELGNPDVYAAILAADPVKPADLADLLARAARTGQEPLVRLLLARGADPNRWLTVSPDEAKRWGRETAVAAAVRAGQDGCLDVLLGAGGNPHAALQPPAPDATQFGYDYAPRTLLHLARTPHAVRVLVELGVDPDAVDGADRVALAIAYDRAGVAGAPPPEETTALVGALLDAGARPVFAASKSNIRPATHVLVAAARASCRNAGDFVRHLAARGIAWPEEVAPRSPKEAHWLAEHGVVLDVAGQGRAWLRQWLTGYDGRGIAYESQELARLGIDLSSRYPDGTTPFLLALKRGEWKEVEALMKAGADPDAGPSLTPGTRLKGEWWREINDFFQNNDTSSETHDNEVSEFLEGLAALPHVRADVLAHALTEGLVPKPPGQGARVRL